MKRFIAPAVTGAAFSFLFTAGAPSAQDKQPRQVVDKGPEHHVLYEPKDIEWREGPASLEPGAQFAVLEGNPSKAGVFTMRLKMPDGYTIAPHWHPNVERVTVVSGTFHLGDGEKVDKQAAQAMPAGSYAAMPPGMRHYAITEGETVVQLTSVGPWKINYVHREDDPRAKD